MRIYHKIAFLCIGQVLCLSSAITTFAQSATRLQTHEVEKRGDYFSYQTARISGNQPYVVQPDLAKPDLAFTSVVLQIDPAYNYDQAFIVSNTDTLQLLADEHAPHELEKRQSNLVIFAHPVREFLLYPGNIKGDIVFNFLNAGKLTIKDKSNKTSRIAQADDPCAEPEAISQEEWRKGLPAPTYIRSFHEVAHLIVHHAATDNARTDYTEVVRNIYLWHTQTNGWSDIGYNYLIAQDGTIYKGRDPGEGEQDNVRGAHFCGKNTGTMGICLLGTYTDVAPTDTTVASLLKLMAWKVNKDQLDPLAFKAHAANPNLGVIAGHRDGCSTLCPGDRVYAKLQEFREVTELVVSTICNPILGNEKELPEKMLKVYPVPAGNEIHVILDHPHGEPPERIQEIKLFEVNGREVAISPFWQGNELSFSTTHLSGGIYVLRLILEDKILTRKIVIGAY